MFYNRVQRSGVGMSRPAGNRQVADRAAMAAAVRESFPVATSVADIFKEFFGDGVRLTYAAENGVKVGKPDTDVGFPVSQIITNPVVLTSRGNKC